MGKVVKLEPHNLQSGQRRARAKSPLTPELKGFIDRVIVPILVRDYLSGVAQEKEITDGGEGVASCNSMAVSLNAKGAQ